MSGTILVVEDEALIRLVAVQVLEEEGNTVYEAASVLEAVGLLASHPEIDVVFTDVNMPGLTGLDLARLVARNYPRTGILVTSGRYSIPTRELPVGARFLPKPYPIERLARTVAELMPETIADHAEHTVPSQLKELIARFGN
jgi:CheY-like chemotaxis protein